MFYSNIQSIGGVEFTPREIDVISCIINNRGTKKIADILAISPRTVQGHVQNILAKISKGSQENIKDFVEKSDNLLDIQQHYADILASNLFEQQIKKIAALIGRNKKTCVIISEDKGDFADFIVKYLKLTKIDLIVDPFDFNNIDNQAALVIFSAATLVNMVKKKPFKEVILISNSNQENGKNLKQVTNLTFIDCDRPQKIYSAVLKILAILFPNIDFSNYAEEFTKGYNNINTRIIPFQVKQESLEDIGREKPLFKYGKNILALTVSIFIISILAMWVYNSGGYKTVIRKESVSISYNFSLPGEGVLLKRVDVITKVKESFKDNAPIKTVVLTGVPGAGKATIARQYALEQNSQVAWEINATSQSTLVSSIKQLAYALCISDKEKQELETILAIKDVRKRDAQLLCFLKNKLKKINNWLLIYVNIESFKDIQGYFPANPKEWGNGKIIITTKGESLKAIKDTLHSEVINVTNLSEQEKLRLFTSIINDGQALKLPDIDLDKKVLESFLAGIPSLPQDVAAAAHYIKKKGLGSKKYMEAQMKSYKKLY